MNILVVGSALFEVTGDGVIRLKIEPLDDKTVKVVLSKNDMEGYRLTYEEMDYNNPDTRRVILRLIEQIKKEVAIDLSQGKLFIEAFPYADGGCILYVNVLDVEKAGTPPGKHRTSFDTPLIFAFDNLDSLAALSGRLNRRYSHVILKNSLYYMEGSYYLMIYTYFKMDSQITHLLNEYGRFAGKGAVRSSFIQEHAKELLKADASQTIERTLS